MQDGTSWTIPGCDARFYEEKGHPTLPHNWMREILSTLLARVLEGELEKGESGCFYESLSAFF